MVKYICSTSEEQTILRNPAVIKLVHILFNLNTLLILKHPLTDIELLWHFIHLDNNAFAYSIKLFTTFHKLLFSIRNFPTQT